jgi:hypothetical protein
MTKRDLTKLTPAQRTALVLRVNKNTYAPPIQADKDKTQKITGRWNNHKDV